jgi:putative hydrolase of the HAD superfamily
VADLRAVTLDAAGTLIEVAEPVGGTYARFAARHGIAIAPDDVERGFRAAFASAPPLAFPGASPLRLADHERAWWYAVVRRAFGAAAAGPAVDACFDAHYAGAAAWRVHREVPDALRRLRARGLRLAVVSNFDARLVPLLGALGIAPLVDRVVHSTRAGAAKPDPAIFADALAALGVPAAAALHAGDRIDADVDGARAAGMRAALVDRGGRAAAPAGADVVRSLDELTAVVGAG